MVTIGILIFCLTEPTLLPGVVLLPIAVVLEAAAVATISYDNIDVQPLPHLSLSSLLFEAAPVGMKKRPC